jgi:serine/threonine-protein kinase
MEGQTIAGKYRLVRLLGKGGMGSVWLAEHLTLKTPVAIKLIDFVAAKNAQARARFDREAQVAARIRSAHVVKVLDHGVTDEDRPYIAMECLNGESLRERLQARGRLSAAETAKVVSHVCRALSRAHEAGLVHRDIKPENVFMAREDDGEIVKILDFGVAKATDMLAAEGMDPTRTGALLGTPYYMSPEQAQGLKTVDYRSDLWSMGVLVFECLTGKRPFTAPALGPLIAKIVHTPAPTLAQVAPGVAIPAELEAWMAKALSRDPAQRHASAKDLSDSFMVAAGAVDTLDQGPSGSAPSISTAAAPRAEPATSATGTVIMANANEASDLDDAATIALPSPEERAAAAPTPLSNSTPSPSLGTSTVSPDTKGKRGLVWAVVVLAVALAGALAVLATMLMRK